MVILSYEMWFVANMSKSSLVKTLFLRLGLILEVYITFTWNRGLLK